MLFPPTVQTCYSEGEDGLEFFDEEFLAMRYHYCRSYGVMESSAVLFCSVSRESPLGAHKTSISCANMSSKCIK
jgi:hypothetical protein